MLPKLFGHRKAFSGELEDIGVMSLLQTLGANRSTGTLLVRIASVDGAVHLEKGELVHAELGEVSGPKAFYRLVALPQRQFTFLDACQLPDLDICRILLMLMQKYIVIATPESVLSTHQMDSPIDAE